MLSRNGRLLGVFLLVFLMAWAGPGLAAPPNEKGKDETTVTPKDLEAIWTDLKQNDDEGSKKAFAGICLMIRSPKIAVPFLKDRLKPTLAPDEKRIEQCLADLDHAEFNKREKATKDLDALGLLAGPALTKKLKDTQLSLEARNRMEKLVRKIDENALSSDELRDIRSIEILEGIGSPQAKEILEKLAKGAPGARTTDDAKEALQRLAKRQ